MSHDTKKIIKARAKRFFIPQKDAAIIMAAASGKKPQAAVAAAGYQMTPKNAERYVDTIKKRHGNINAALIDSLADIGVDIMTVADKIRDGLNATTTTKSGSSVMHVPDYNVRHKYLETAIDVMGAKAPTKSIVEQVKTHEQTIAIVEGIRADPEVLEALRKRLGARTIDITEESRCCEPSDPLRDRIPSGDD